MTVPSHSSRPYTRLPILILLLTAVVVAMGAVGLYYVEQRLVTIAGENLSFAAAQTAQNLDRLLFERSTDAQMMARAFAKHSRHLGYLTEYMVWMRTHYPVYLWLGVTDEQGRIVASSDPVSVGQEYGLSDWFQMVKRERVAHVGDVEPYESAGGVDSVAFTAPIIGPQGEFLGVVTSRVGLPAIEQQVTKNVKVFEQREGF
ncbi:MAG: PDC sensor domain-containing protein [Nitrospiraceae bacterium]